MSEGWITCPKCGFSQSAGPNCAKCGLVFAKWEAHQRAKRPTAPTREAAPVPSRPEVPAGTRRRTVVVGAAAAGILAAILTALVLARGGGPRKKEPAPAASPAPAAADLSLAGVWDGRVVRTVAGRRAIKMVSIESNKDGDVTAASVAYRIPGALAVGAGYRWSVEGAHPLDDVLSRVDDRGRIPGYAPLFLPLPPELGPPARAWYPIEGYWKVAPHGRRAGAPKPREEITYVLFESTDGGNLVQFGVTDKGFQSFVYFTQGQYEAASIGHDRISAAITPTDQRRLANFERLVWDLSGNTTFSDMRVEASVSAPDGHLDMLTLVKR
jgi:hypothetical protein